MYLHLNNNNDDDDNNDNSKVATILSRNFI